MAAANMKSVKLRIKSIQNTMQITKAMELVASSKLRRAKEKAEASAPYFSSLRQTLINIAAENTDYTSVYARENKSERYCYILIAGDRGMAGGYNANLFRAFEAESKGKNFSVLPLGKKAQDYVSQKKLERVETENIPVASVRISDCFALARMLCRKFREGEFGHVSLFYTSFVSLMKQEPGSSMMLPIADFKSEVCEIYGKEGEEKKQAQNLILYEPSAEEVYDAIVPEYLAGLLYSAVSSSLASEYAARRTAMEAATDNAAEMIDKLSLYYNRARQASITQEITEIVGGAEGSNG